MQTRPSHPEQVYFVAYDTHQAKKNNFLPFKTTVPEQTTPNPEFYGSHWIMDCHVCRHLASLVHPLGKLAIEGLSSSTFQSNARVTNTILPVFPGARLEHQRSHRTVYLPRICSFLPPTLPRRLQAIQFSFLKFLPGSIAIAVKSDR